MGEGRWGEEGETFAEIEVEKNMPVAWLGRLSENIACTRRDVTSEGDENAENCRAHT